MNGNGIQPTVELATTNGNVAYPYPVYPMYGNGGFGGSNGFLGGDGIWAILLFALLFGNGYTGYYNVNFSASISSATAGVVAIGLYEDGILIPDTVRAVTIATADDYETISFNKKIRVCPRGTTNITVASVPSVPTPTMPTTPIETEIPIITNATFNVSRTNN